MTNYVVAAADGIKNLATGQSWAKGQAIGQGRMNPRLWAALLAEGAVVEVQELPEPVPEPEPAPPPKKTTRSRKVTK